jgi:hypothetical protein
MRKTLVAAALLAVSGLALAPPADADVISIGLQQAGVDGGAITTVASGTSNASFGGSYGSFSFNSISGATSPSVAFPDLVFSNAIDTSADTSGTLTVWVSGTA